MTYGTLPPPRFSDHVHVFGLMVLTLLGLLPYGLFLLVSPVAKPLLRARYRRRLRRLEHERVAEPAAIRAQDWDGKTLLVVAGEPSGDALAAPVVRALERLAPGLRVRGLAGPASRAAGMELDLDLLPHTVIGFLPVVRTLPFWWGLCARVRALLRDAPPDLMLTVDFPGLNVRLARWARAGGVPTAHLVAPATWALAGWRVWRWRRAVDHVLALLPFEPALLAGSGLRASFVGHPLFEAPLAPPRTPEAWPGAGPCVIELLPGSRRVELRRHSPLMLEAAALVARRLPQVRFVVRLADERHRPLFEAAARTARARPERLSVSVGLAAAGEPLLAALASSGTVTAELAAALVPMTVTYWLPWWTRVGGMLFLTAPYFALVNLVAGRRVVTERLVTFRSASRHLADDLLAVAADPEAWLSQRAALREVRGRLERPDVAERAARALLASRGGARG